MPGSIPKTEDVVHFYRAAALGLAVLEARSGGARRFGANADARWNAFRGGLGDWDRLELLVRDAAVRSPAGFAPRMVFDLAALADDEPCGPDWPGPPASDAAALLRAAASNPGELAPALDAVATTWGLSPRLLPERASEAIQPATRLLLTGAGAVISVAKAFWGRPELDLSDQAVLVADDPGTRQLFGLALAFLGGQRPPRVVCSVATVDDVRALGLSALNLALVSDDVSSEVRAQAGALAKALGAKG